MEWLSELVKHITLSRTLSGATFVTSASLMLGHKWLPGYIEPLPKEWGTPTSAALIFSGALLFFWLVPAVWKVGTSAIIWIPKNFLSKSLSPNEKALMQVLAKLADESLNLNHLAYQSGVLTKLEVLDVTASLARKGLLDINPFEENLVCLSSKGRRRALALANNMLSAEHAA